MCAVEFGDARVHQHVVGEQEFAVVGRLAPHDALDEKAERFAQVGDERGVEFRECLRVFRQRLRFAGAEPVVEKVGEFRLGARVVHHARRLRANLLGRVDFAFADGLQQREVRERIPHRKCQSRGGGEVVGLGQLGVKKARGLQHGDDAALHGDLRRDVAHKHVVHVERPQLRREPAAEGTQGKRLRPRFQLLRVF